MSKNNLPDTPWELIRLAIADLEKVEALPDYEIDMEIWHIPQPNGRCAVCLAGAVMVSSLGLNDYRVAFNPSYVAERSKLFALDRLRFGDTKSGLEIMGWNYRDMPDIQITPYKHSAEVFKKDMMDLASCLEAYFTKGTTDDNQLRHNTGIPETDSGSR